MRMLLTLLAIVASATDTTAAAAAAASHGHMHVAGGSSSWLAPFTVGLKQASITSRRQKATTGYVNFIDVNVVENKIRGGGRGSTITSSTLCTGKPPARFLKWAYSACGLATTAAWSTVVYTTIRSNQPLGAMMPSWQHQFFARMGAISAVPLIIGSFGTLAYSASKATDSWEQLGTPTNRRHNLALATAGIGSALWTNFAEIITQIPGSNPVASHQVYHGATKWCLIGCYGSGAALAAAVWARSLPDDVRSNPLLWPGRVVDGVCKSMVSLAPANREDPVNVKYAILATSFLGFSLLPILCSFPSAVIPSWTSRRLSRAFPAWTLLGAVASFDLKEATENLNGKLFAESKYHRNLSNCLKGFGTLYIAAKAGGPLFDPSFPGAFHVVKQVPGLAVAAILLFSLTLRSDEK